MVTVESFDSFDRIGNVRSRWDELVRFNKLGPAHEVDWLRIIWENSKQDRELAILLLQGSGGLEGVAPMIREHEYRKCVPVRVIKPLNCLHHLRGTQFILAHRSAEHLLERLLTSLAELRRGWDVLFLYYQKDEAQGHELEAYLKSQGYAINIKDAGSALYLTLEKSWEELLQTLHRKFRHELRSREKRFREQGRVEIKFLDGPDRWKEGLATLAEIEGQSWKQAGGFPITHPHHWNFYQEYAAVAACRGTLRLPILFVNGEPVAFDYGILDDGIYYLLQTSYKEKWSALYPGSVLRKLVIEWLCENKVREVDFGLGEDVWKSKWTDSVRTYSLYTVFGRTLRGHYLSWMTPM